MIVLNIIKLNATLINCFMIFKTYAAFIISATFRTNITTTNTTTDNFIYFIFTYNHSFINHLNMMDIGYTRHITKDN